MTDRIIDPRRPDSEGIGLQRLQAAPEMTFEEAVEYHKKFAWRALPTKGNQALAACIREVERLREVQTATEALADWERETRQMWALKHRIAAFQLDVTNAEAARFRAALPEIIGCAHGEAATCDRDPYGWGPCCLIRRRMMAAGLLLAVERMTEEDGA